MNNLDRPSGGSSVTKVSKARWLEAQAWERQAWRNAEPGRLKNIWRRISGRNVDGDDWNCWWAEQFGGYEFLPKDLGAYIELGCGPYTNTRLIIANRSTTRCVCSDPLIHTYLEFEQRWLSSAHHLGIVEVDDHPVEDLPFAAGTFDTVVMINVLDHVQDADACLKAAVSLLRPNGHFILGQDLSDDADAQLPQDTGHPIRMHLDDVLLHLGALETVRFSVLERGEGRNPEAHYATLVYVGRAADFPGA